MSRAMSHRPPASFPDNPVLARAWRGEHVESQHRGAWAVVDAHGRVLDGAGDLRHPFFTRSAIKALQALPLFESGAADRFGFQPREIALALASHNAEPEHTEGVAALLARLGLSVEHLRCGPQAPGDPATRRELERAGVPPSALHNNCSGKHAGFLALGRHLGADPAEYLAPEGAVQRAVRSALAEVAGVPESELSWAVDGCGAPTYRLSLTSLGAAFARLTRPDGLGAVRRAAAERMIAAVAAHPTLIAGRHGRLCTALAEAGRGRLFPKVGAEAVYVVGAVGRGQALAVKIDDGGQRALSAVVLAALARAGWLEPSAEPALERFRDPTLVNWAGRPVGRLEVTLG